MAELKPCPFCGESEMLQVEAIDHGKEKRPFGYRWTAKVVCLNCSASCGTHGFQKNEEDGKRMAIRAWNRRTANAAEVKHGEWIEKTFFNGCTLDNDCVCSLCGESGLPYSNFCTNCGAKMDKENKYARNIIQR